MRLDSIVLENYRGFRHLSVRFQPGFNVLAGVNGSGKTSILKGAREALTGLTYHLSLPSANLAPFGELGSVRVESTVAAKRYRFEEQYPAQVEAIGEAFGQAMSWSVALPKPIGGLQFGGRQPGQVWQAASSDQNPDDSPMNSPRSLPIVAFYPAYRQWPQAQVNEMLAATERPSRLDGYRYWWEAAGESSALQQWTISKSMERLQLVSDRSVRWDAINDDELAMVNTALAAVVEGAKGIRYDFAQKCLLIEWQGEATPTEFRFLSDGQRVAIALVADIARRMCLLNPHLGHAVTQQTPGVVLIDELDVHLHPKWQRRITKGLRAAFPQVQFIVASHSPQVLGELQPEQIILLGQDGIDHPAVSYGLDASRVLEQIMEASQRPTEVEGALSALLESLARNEIERAREQLSALKGMAPGIPELAGAEAMLKRKEVLGR
ncbi:AAA family ATPase [Burkholderia gladioli]|uniref:AAA family ATPase n=1 Tax=Burkholderia gladioli TaxID=28095 RepID=UPI003F7B0501